LPPASRGITSHNLRSGAFLDCEKHGIGRSVADDWDCLQCRGSGLWQDYAGGVIHGRLRVERSPAGVPSLRRPRPERTRLGAVDPYFEGSKERRL